jgi:hypothetical protein
MSIVEFVWADLTKIGPTHLEFTNMTSIDLLTYMTFFFVAPRLSYYLFYFFCIKLWLKISRIEPVTASHLKKKNRMERAQYSLSKRTYILSCCKSLVMLTFFVLSQILVLLKNQSIISNILLFLFFTKIKILIKYSFSFLIN